MVVIVFFSGLETSNPNYQVGKFRSVFFCLWLLNLFKGWS